MSITIITKREMQQRQNTLQFVYGSFYLHLSYTANEMIKELPYKNVLPQQLRGKNKNGNWKQKDEYFVLYNILRSTVLNAKNYTFFSFMLLVMHAFYLSNGTMYYVFIYENILHYILLFFALHAFINVHFIVLPSQYAIDLGNDFVIFILLPISSYLVLLFQGACCFSLALFSTLNIVRYD